MKIFIFLNYITKEPWVQDGEATIRDIWRGRGETSHKELCCDKGRGIFFVQNAPFEARKWASLEKRKGKFFHSFR